MNTRVSLVAQASPGGSGGSGSPGLERLVGVPAPAVALPFASEASASLAALAYGRSLVVFFYPGIRSQRNEEGPADVDRARALAWGESDPELDLLGYMVVGVSTQSPEVQAQFASDGLLGYMLLSDSELQLAGELGLPTTGVVGEKVYEPLTLIVRAGLIARVFYPVDPGCDAAIVCDWIRRTHV